MQSYGVTQVIRRVKAHTVKILNSRFDYSLRLWFFINFPTSEKRLKKICPIYLKGDLKRGWSAVVGLRFVTEYYPCLHDPASHISRIIFHTSWCWEQWDRRAPNESLLHRTAGQPQPMTIVLTVWRMKPSIQTEVTPSRKAWAHTCTVLCLRDDLSNLHQRPLPDATHALPELLWLSPWQHIYLPLFFFFNRFSSKTEFGIWTGSVRGWWCHIVTQMTDQSLSNQITLLSQHTYTQRGLILFLKVQL